MNSSDINSSEPKSQQTEVPAPSTSKNKSTEESSKEKSTVKNDDQDFLTTLNIQTQTHSHNTNELILPQQINDKLEKLKIVTSQEHTSSFSSASELRPENPIPEVKVWTAEGVLESVVKHNDPTPSTSARKSEDEKSVTEIKATGDVRSADIADVLSQADEVSRIPERDSVEPIFLNAKPPQSKASIKRRRRRKRKKSGKVTNAGDGPNPNDDSGSEDSSDCSTGCTDGMMDSNSAGDKTLANGSLIRLPGAARRTRIPDRPNISLNLWGLLKNSLGKELSKIPMPVNFSEPLSMLQRLTEDYEYSDILDKAAKCTDSCEQMCFVAAFTISSYASTSVRTAKPFNPLLGETFEWDRTSDLGWKCISEQTSHHPPTAALYCEGINGWKCWQEFTMTSKFKGNSLEIIPLGVAHLTFEASGNHYTWRKVTTVVRNIIVGKLWVEQTGDMIITNHTTGDKCQISYLPEPFFGKNKKEIAGTVKNKSGVLKWVLNGNWDSKVEAAQVKATAKLAPDEKLKPTDKSASTVLWVRHSAPPGAEKYYNFTEFAVQLNEMEADVAPTDSRLRPDQRLMELGKWDEANAEKLRLEEKQRNARKLHSSSQTSAGGDKPATWFQKEKDPVEGTAIYTFKGEYWKCKSAKDWSKCPDIY